MAVALNQTHNTDSVTIFRLAGEIGSSEMDAVLRMMNDVVLKNRCEMVLNFAHVNHVALDAISTLAQRKERFRALGGDIKLVGLAPYVANLFKLVGAFSYFEILSNEEEAVARFES